MTVAEEPRRENRLLMLVGHYSFPAFLPVGVLVMADDITLHRFPALDWASTLACVLWTALSIIGGDYHQDRLCERCIAASPLDPQAQVGRWRRALRWHHARRRWLAAMFALMALDLWSGWGGNRRPWWGYVPDAVFVLFLAGVLVAAYAHRRLYPWCPWCHWDDGGEHEVSPDVPAPAMSR